MKNNPEKEPEVRADRAALSAQTGEPVTSGTFDPQVAGFSLAAHHALCSDCPPDSYPTDITRCAACPRRSNASPPPQPDTAPSPLSRVCDCVGPAEADPQPCRCEKSDDRFWQGYNAGLKAPRHAPGQPPSPLSTGEVIARETLEREIEKWETDKRTKYPDNEVLESLDRLRTALSQPPATEQPVLRPINWSLPLETSEDKPRLVKALGGHKGAVEYVDVEILGGDDLGPHRHHPAGKYCAEKASGLIRGTLAVRNVPSPATEQIRREVIEEQVADQIIGAIEERFPNWRSYRDLIDCIDCTLHELREKRQ